MPTPMKMWPSLDGENLVISYYLSVSEISPDKKDGLWWE
jgi:hypothetical protein